MARLANHFDEFLAQPNLSIVLNTEGMYFLDHEPKFRQIVRDADLIFIDGVGLKVALQFSGRKDVKRLHGPDLFHHTLHQDNDKKQLIVGGSEQSHQMLVEKYSALANNPKIEFYSAIVREEDLTDLYAKMNQYQPDVVYVCLGIRKQEFIGARLREKYPDCCIVGVGAAIDFESGNVKRSSPVFQKMGLEWLPRLLREPRMIPRIVRSLRAMISYSVAGLLGIDKKESDLISIVDSGNQSTTDRPQ